MLLTKEEILKELDGTAVTDVHIQEFIRQLSTTPKNSPAYKSIMIEMFKYLEEKNK